LTERFDPPGVSALAARVSALRLISAIPDLAGNLRPGLDAKLSTILARKERSMNPHERPIVTKANEEAIRAGSTGHHVRYVLIASCALVILGFIVIALLIKP
jgi:hypothetical protein